MIKVALVGTGTVSSHLKKVFSKAKGIELTQVISSRGDAISNALKAPRKNDTKKKVDIYIIAVSDAAISSISQLFIDSNEIIVHTSGSVPLEALPDRIRGGVFYPLQTFSKEKKVDFKTIPICIEAKKDKDLELLRKLAESISEAVYEITSKQRKSLHLAAVFTNNFTNHLYQIGSEICGQNEVPFEILKPLILETAEKIMHLPPKKAQTGPAIRDDQEVIAKQLKQLKNENHKTIYKILTESILETHGEKL